ncbi:MAG: PASTA domain-containing protein [Candidatus Marinimicrobia bacterium]|nr:PASTA domain-containing protein [Candidatus Neomarinimicrobiota bacterium]
MIDDVKKLRDPYSLRVAVITTVVLVFVTIILVRLVAIQLFDSEDLRGYADSQGLRTEDILPERGHILDRNGNILANNIIEYSIGARYVDLLQPESCYASLAKAFDRTPAYYRNQFKKESSFYILETKVRPEIVDKLCEDNSCHGLKYDKKMSRIYPYQDAAGQLIGFLWDDGSGQAGIEQYYDEILIGKKGHQMIQRDKRGDVITLQNANTQSAVPGGDVQLTIDIEYQVILEEELAEAVKKNKGKSGMGVIMDPQTGEILAIANYPEFNPNEVRNSSPDIRRNRVIADQFEPGSIYKVIPAAAALENNIFTPTSQIFCENGEWKVRDRIIHDTKPHEWLTVEEVIVYSSNIGAGKICEQLGNQTIYDISRKFGFGEPSAVGLWGESSGLLKTPDKWSSVGYTQLAMGHGVTVTLMQMMAAYSAIANGGTLMKPYVVSRTFNEKNKIKNEYDSSPVRRVITEKTSATLRAIMEGVVNIGTAQRAQIDGYHVAGKTGTAQKVIDGKYSSSKYYASFIGYFPSSAPVLVCGIVIDEPAFGLHHGGTSVAPAVKNTFTRIINTPEFHQLYPTVSKTLAEEKNKIEAETTTSNPLLSMLHSTAKANDKEVKITNTKEIDPEPVISQDQDNYDIIMPDVTGIHILNAEKKLQEIGLKVERNSDRGKVTSQFPAPGTFLNESASCRLEVGS